MPADILAFATALSLMLSIVSGIVSLLVIGKEHKSPRLFLGIISIVLVIGTLFFGGLTLGIIGGHTQAQSSVTPSPGPDIQLHHSYRGNAWGYAR